MISKRPVWCWLSLFLCMVTAGPTLAACGTAQVAVQVLGSGGPVPDGDRASAGYVVWIDGRSRLLVDAGGGTFLRFGQAGAKIEDLDFVAITHLHVDHVADLPALLKGGFFADRTRALPLSGPTGGGAFPGMREFVAGLFGPKHGIFRYLDGFMDGSGGLFETPVTEVDASRTTPRRIYTDARMQIAAIGVHHGPVPALGYLVTVRGKRIAFSGDQNGQNPQFARMIRGADVLIMDHAVAEYAGPVARRLHAMPSEIGALARSAGVKELVLSHWMARSLVTRDRGLALIRERYQGPVVSAKDLQCIVVTAAQAPHGK